MHVHRRFDSSTFLSSSLQCSRHVSRGSGSVIAVRLAASRWRIYRENELELGRKVITSVVVVPGLFPEVLCPFAAVRRLGLFGRPICFVCGSQQKEGEDRAFPRCLPEAPVGGIRGNGLPSTGKSSNSSSSSRAAAGFGCVCCCWSDLGSAAVSSLFVLDA
ncbi:hypothetical protein VTK73DRAFT_3699 [Phialemonium thermophilum]|uniref:Uncharacterized protein n=1 Tax=Phialemonium thermophilum TaxID=223376 RepID=A0ABR3VFQ6_9PEZI